MYKDIKVLNLVNNLRTEEIIIFEPKIKRHYGSQRIIMSFAGRFDFQGYCSDTVKMLGE